MERGRRRTLCASQGRGLCFIWFCVCVRLLPVCAIRHLRICAFNLVSVGKHKFGYSPGPYNSRSPGQGQTCQQWWQQHWEVEPHLFKPCCFFHCSPASPNQHLSTHKACWGDARRRMVFLSSVIIMIQRALRFVLKSLASSKHLSLMVQSRTYLSPICWTCSGKPDKPSVRKFGKKEVVWQQGF